MKLQSNVSVDAEREIIVDNAQRWIVLSVRRIFCVGIRFYVEIPTVEKNRGGVANVGENFSDGFVSVSLQRRTESIAKCQLQLWKFFRR